MGLWDKLKEILGFGTGDASKKNDPNDIRNRIINADRHHFRVSEPEPKTAER